MTQVVSALPVLTHQERDHLATKAKIKAVHSALMSELACMTQLEVSGDAPNSRLPAEFSVAAWNLERCLFPKASAEHLAAYSPSVVLLSEMDCGMSRSGQRHTTQDVAAALNMQYVYGVEFLELSLFGPTERSFCQDEQNTCGFHGNAILSSVPFERVEMVRLDTDGHWFTEGAADPDQPRIGDLNTGNHLPPNYDWREETLFETAVGQGYSWDLTADGMTTRPSLITPHPDRKMKLDWFCTRGIGGGAKAVVSSVAPDGTPLSDHDFVWTELRL